MSRIGRNPIAIPAGVDVVIDGQNVTVKGPKGTLSHVVAEPITAKIEDGQVIVERPNDERTSRSLHGLSRTLIANMIVQPIRKMIGTHMKRTRPSSATAPRSCFHASTHTQT